MSEISASDYISQQEALEVQARELMPWDPTKCTYSMGSIRQPIFACRSCGDIGVCYSCSIQCHTNCNLVELFYKRQFSCDCGTERQRSDNKKCRLRGNETADIPDYSNRYGQNFRGLFCDCGQEYDPNTNSTMLQCILGLECNEDWYHDYCILGCTNNPNIKESESKLGGFPSLESFEAFICWKCVSKYHSQFSRLLCHNLADDIVSDTVMWVPCSSLKEREAKLEQNNNSAKRKRYDGEYSVFLKERYSSTLDKLKSLLPKEDMLRIFLADIASFLIRDDPIYEPPEDTDPVSSYEAASQALRSVGHQNTIDGLIAYQAIKSKLSSFLRPFAETGTIVKEEDIKSFFKSQKKPSSGSS
ncbi:uncharacterized protein Ecym_2351 [Eremothecium cymbalariae DBVPG|uniref:UBR-type domain-containing protein n=1 Tax=Eremothecium cymbalariae (strain CBS 270.75 / DBVPG 7215 / KCTC 17166 / NRRL Y-17582) TaxID=931890 RepID=G8JNL7_ERECY|nr:Hypothetical protein Ecym_2351 [Eremothecium cymbalariae DBVPG\